MSKNTQCYTTPVRLEGPGNPLPAITENVSNEAKSLALLRAIESRNYKIIPYLLEEGADINYHDNNGKSALHEACAQKNIHLIRLLVVKGADVNYSSNNYGCTFHKICEFANAEDINSLIIKYHADVNKLDHNGETVLKRACMRGNIEVAKLLIEHGAIDDSIEYMRPMTTMQAYIAAHEWCKNAFFKATPEYGHLSTEAKTIMKKIVANKFIHDHYTQQEINNFFVFHRTSEILANARDDIINRVSNGNVDSYKQSNTYQDSSKDSLCLETKKRANENPDEPLTNKVAKTDSYASSEGIKKPTTKVHNKQLLVLDAGLYHKPPNSNKISNQGARNKPSIADKALLDAVWSGKPEECLQALRAGVSEEAKNNALMRAIELKNTLIEGYLREYGVDVNRPFMGGGMTPLHAACRCGKEELTKSLLKNYNANVDQPDNSGNTPLDVAYMKEGVYYIEVIKTLIEHGAKGIVALIVKAKIPDHIAAQEWCKNALFKATPEYRHLSAEAKIIMEKIVANTFIHYQSTQKEINDFFEFHSASEILANARDHIINRISNRNVDSCKQSNAPQNSSKDEQWAVKVLMDLKVGDLTEDPNEQSKVAKTDNNSPYHSEHIIGKAGHTEVLGECHDTHH